MIPVLVAALREWGVCQVEGQKGDATLWNRMKEGEGGGCGVVKIVRAVERRNPSLCSDPSSAPFKVWLGPFKSSLHFPICPLGTIMAVFQGWLCGLQ